MLSVTDAILDTSVLLAFALNERHDVNPDTLISGAAVSTVSLAEFRSRLLLKHVAVEDIDATLHDFNLKLLPFGPEEAELAGNLIPIARPLNIGLGDCACIATGIAHGRTIWTADRDWLKLEAPGADIQLIRNQP